MRRDRNVSIRRACRVFLLECPPITTSPSSRKDSPRTGIDCVHVLLRCEAVSRSEQDNINPSLSRQLSGWLSRDEFLATLFILGCLNGLGSQVAKSVRAFGWTDALLSTFGISAIVWIACFGGLSLILRDKTGIIRPLDLILGLAFLLLIALPINSLGVQSRSVVES
jgi:hypothetical protein